MKKSVIVSILLTIAMACLLWFSSPTGATFLDQEEVDARVRGYGYGYGYALVK